MGLRQLRSFVYRSLDDCLKESEQFTSDQPPYCGFSLEDEKLTLGCASTNSVPDARIKTKEYSFESTPTKEIVDFSLKSASLEKICSVKISSNSQSKTTELTAHLPGLSNLLTSSGLYSSNSLFSDDLRIIENDGKTSVLFTYSQHRQTDLDQLISQELSDVTSFLPLRDLKQKLGIAAWLEAHQQEIKLRKDFLEQYQRFMELGYIPLFAEEIRTKGNYTALFSREYFKEFFDLFSSLKDPLFNLSTLKTDIEDPLQLNNYLQSVREAINSTNSNYRRLVPKINLSLWKQEDSFILQTSKAFEHCKGTAGACYDHYTNTIHILSAFTVYAFIHELAHAYHDHLSDNKYQSLESLLTPLVTDKKVTEDYAFNPYYLETWKDGTKSARYWFTDPHGASNVPEYVATTVEDIYTNKSKIIINILQSEYKDKMVFTLETISRFGFFGDVEEASTLLNRIYTQSSLDQDTVQQLYKKYKK